MNAIVVYEPAEMARLYRTTQQLPSYTPGTTPRAGRGWWAARVARRAAQSATARVGTTTAK